MIDKILLKDSFEFNGNISEFKEKVKLNRERKFELEWINHNEFKFLSNFSLGTLMVDGFPGAVDGIKGYGKIKEIKNGKTNIDLRTKIRVELYVVLFVLLFIFFCGYMAGENFPFWIYLLLPICLLWFWFILRMQEKRLFKKLKEYINRI